MSGSFSYTGSSSILGGTTVPVAVYRLVSGYASILPNVQPLAIAYVDGDDPPTAQFAYWMDDRAYAAGYPTQYEQLWPLATSNGNYVGPYVVQPGDELAVYCQMPDGSTDLLFHGFARMPQANVAGEGQHQVTFTAVGVAIRAYDVPIVGRLQRNGDLASVTTTDGSDDIATDLPTRFNPVDERHPTGQPNCTPQGFDSDPDGDGPGVGYPVFLDPNIDRPGDIQNSPRLWTLSSAIKYLLANYNPPGAVFLNPDDPTTPTYQQFVTNPDFTNLDDILDNRSPSGGNPYFDPTNPSTYTANPIIVRDFDCTNMAWPEAVSRLLGYHGFGMRWVTGQNGDGSPFDTFDVYRKDAANPDAPKWIFHPSAGTPITAGNCNVGGLQASFDYHGVANSFEVETHPNRYEISVIIPPLFTPTASDATADQRPQFRRAALDTATETIRRAYRWFGVDELGDGYYDGNQAQLIKGKPFDFSPLWPGGPDPDTGAFTPSYVTSLRPPVRDCLADDGNGDVLKAQLALSRNYAGVVRDFWDGSGDWQPVEGDWKLLDDRLGIEITADDPEAIHCGKSNFAAQTQNAGAVLKGITSLATPGPATRGGGPNITDRYFTLRLTCVVYADQTIEGSAPRRPASPLLNEVRRRIDAKDHFRKDTIHLSSAFYSEQQMANPATPTDNLGNLLTRDDTAAANDYAAQLRTAHEFPAVPMTVTIPFLTLAYQVGDRISLIAGRNASLQTNGGTQSGAEAPSYPFIVGCSWSFAGDQQVTTLTLSDRRMEPQPLEHRRGR